jgi:DNA end-binding protein Ku
MVLSTMFFADEVRDLGDLDLPGKARLTDRERKIAEQLIDSLATDFDPKRYADTYRQRVLELIEAKAKGKEIVTEEPEETPEVGGLMEALRLSVESARQRPTKKRSTSKKTPAKGKSTAKPKTTAKKTSSRSKRKAA